MFQSYLGIKKDYDKWNDLSEENNDKELEITKQELQMLLDSINPEALDFQTRISYQLFKENAENQEQEMQNKENNIDNKEVGIDAEDKKETEIEKKENDIVPQQSQQRSQNKRQRRRISSALRGNNRRRSSLQSIDDFFVVFGVFLSLL